jgi:hypothetical protein
MNNQSKFDKVSQEVYECNYNELPSEKAKKYVVNKLITQDNRVYCEYCGTEDHNNEGKCLQCNAIIGKKTGNGFVDSDNIIISKGNNNKFFQGNKVSSKNKIKSEGDDNFIIQNGDFNGNVNITFN